MRGCPNDADIVILVLMGVAGSGKTSIGVLLAERLGCAFLDGDSLHSKESIEQMSQGIPLTDAIRGPWLAAIRERMRNALANNESLVVACSALKQRYRDFLSEGVPIRWVYLQGPEHLIRSRLQTRTNHFLKEEMLASQLDVLEEPRDAMVVDISATPSEIVDDIVTRLAEMSGGS